MQWGAAGWATTPPDLCVNPTGSAGCYSTLQAAIDAAPTRTTINVATGNYRENVQINQTAKPKALTLTIIGAGSDLTVINGGGLASVFAIGSKAIVTLESMRITNGAGQPLTSLSATLIGGGIYASAATVTISDCKINYNTANQGAGIYSSDGSLTLIDSQLNNNDTAINAVSQGGGIYFSGGGAHKLTITNSTIFSNTSDFTGGGIMLVAFKEPIRVKATISGSMIMKNSATDRGGGILADDSKTTIFNSTITENSASSEGGGILASNGTVTLNNATVVDNTANALGGGIYIDPDNLKFIASNSLIANNRAPSGPDCSGGMISHDYNLIGNVLGCTISDKASHNLTGASPTPLNPMIIGPAYNGGDTLTQALASGSPALAAGNPAPPNGLGSHCKPTDQVGTARTEGNCDIGAYQQP